jgi:predicted transcriptional regulator
MATTHRNRKAATPPPAPKQKRAGDVVVSIRVKREILSQVDDLAADMDRSRASVLARAVAEYVEQEYPRLLDLRAAERELDEGKGISHEQVGHWLEDLRAGKGRPERLK